MFRVTFATFSKDFKNFRTQISNSDKISIESVEVLGSALESPSNMLVCAPTGAGKTNVAVLTILQLVSKHLALRGAVDASFKPPTIACGLSFQP